MEKVDSHQGGFAQNIEAMCLNYSKTCLSFLCITNSRVFFWAFDCASNVCHPSRNY